MKERIAIMRGSRESRGRPFDGEGQAGGEG